MCKDLGWRQKTKQSQRITLTERRKATGVAEEREQGDYETKVVGKELCRGGERSSRIGG